MFRLTSFKKRPRHWREKLLQTPVLYLNTSMHTHLLKCCFNAQNYPINGSLTRDFRLLVFSLISFPLVPFTNIRVDIQNFVFVAGIIDTGDTFSINRNPTGQQHLKKIWKEFLTQNIFHFSPMLLTPVITLYFRISTRNFVNIWNCPNGILRGPGENDSC